ncbi:Uncharacterised protein [Vibrio cholerae]|nr:Uncharacterised protein [Vibrio cholerae]
MRYDHPHRHPVGSNQTQACRFRLGSHAPSLEQNVLLQLVARFHPECGECSVQAC